jgi:polysaccharide export outer membrane protein
MARRRLDRFQGYIPPQPTSSIDSTPACGRKRVLAKSLAKSGNGLAALTTLLIMGVTASAQQDKPAPAPTPERVEAPKVPSSLPPDATGLPIDPHSYIIGPEDILRISIWREPDLSKIAQVRPDGKITMNLIGDLQASGLTPERLAAQLKDAYSASSKLLQPEISVEMIQINSKSFSIVGGVNHPGKFPLITPIRVFEALTQAAGFRDFADRKHIKILRADGTSLEFNYNDFVKSKKKAQDQNVFLMNGDTIVVKD